MKVISRVFLIIVAAVSIAWLGNLAVTTAASMPRSGEFRPRHDDHEHHDRAGAGRAGELGASFVLMLVVGSVTVAGSYWTRRLRRRKHVLYRLTRG
jgi:hypothetical protein